MGFEPTITKFSLDALTNWAIRSWVQHVSRAKFVQLLLFLLFVQHSGFIFTVASVSRHICIMWNLAQIMKLVAERIGTYGIHHWPTFLEVARKSWDCWDFNPWSLNFIQMLSLAELSGHKYNSHSETTL